MKEYENEYGYELDEEELGEPKPLSTEQKEEQDEWLLVAASALKEING